MAIHPICQLPDGFLQLRIIGMGNTKGHESPDHRQAHLDRAGAVQDISCLNRPMLRKSPWQLANPASSF